MAARCQRTGHGFGTVRRYAVVAVAAVVVVAVVVELDESLGVVLGESLLEVPVAGGNRLHPSGTESHADSSSPENEMAKTSLGSCWAALSS